MVIGIAVGSGIAILGVAMFGFVRGVLVWWLDGGELWVD